MDHEVCRASKTIRLLSCKSSICSKRRGIYAALLERFVCTWYDFHIIMENQSRILPLSSEQRNCKMSINTNRKKYEVCERAETDLILN